MLLSTLTRPRGEDAFSKGLYKPLCVQSPVVPDLQNMGFGYLQKRGELVSSVLQMGQAFGLNEEVAHDAILLMDRTMSTQIQVTLHRSVTSADNSEDHLACAIPRFQKPP